MKDKLRSINFKVFILFTIFMMFSTAVYIGLGILKSVPVAIGLVIAIIVWMFLLIDDRPLNG